MAASILSAYICTDNPIQDIRKWLKTGSIVRLYNSANEKDGFVFDMRCDKKTQEQVRVIWVDFVAMPDLLKKLPKSLQKDKFTLCHCTLAKKIRAGEIVPITHRRNISTDTIQLLSKKN